MRVMVVSERKTVSKVYPGGERDPTAPHVPKKLLACIRTSTVAIGYRTHTRGGGHYEHISCSVNL